MHITFGFSRGPDSDLFQIILRVVGVPEVLVDSCRGRRTRILNYHARVRTVACQTGGYDDICKGGGGVGG